MILQDILRLLCIIQAGLCSAYGHDLLDDDDETDTHYVDIYSNVTLPCFPYTRQDAGDITYWRREGPHSMGEEVLDDGSLYLSNVTRLNTGYYVCHRRDTDEIIHSVRLVVLGPPDAPENVTVHPSTVIAIVKWHLHLEEDWESSPRPPTTTLHLHYRPVNSSAWLKLPHHLSPTQAQVCIYKMHPNTTYEFEMWASNRYGSSSTVYVTAITLADLSEIEMAKRLEESLDGFHPQVWVVAVAANLMAAGTLAACYFHNRHKKTDEDTEKIELLPNIIENPATAVLTHTRLVRPSLPPPLQQQLYEHTQQELGSFMPL